MERLLKRNIEILSVILVLLLISCGTDKKLEDKKSESKELAVEDSSISNPSAKATLMNLLNETSPERIDSIRNSVTKIINELNINDIELFIERAITHKNKQMLVYGYIFKGDYYRDKEYKFEEALRFYNIALNNENISTVSKVIILNKIALIYHHNYGKYDVALKKYFEAISIADNLSDNFKDSRMLILYANIASIYRMNSQYNKAEEYYLAALELLNKKKDKKGTAKLLIDLSSLYVDMKIIDKAVECIEKSLIINETINSKSNSAEAYNSLGAILFEKKDYTEALKFFFKSLHHFTDLKNLIYIQRAYINIGCTYIELGDYDNSVKYLLLSIKHNTEFIENYKSIKHLCLSYKHLAEKSKSNGDYLNATKNYELFAHYQHLVDSIEVEIFNVDKQNTIAEVNAKYQTEIIEKEKEQAESLREKAEETQILLAAILIISIIGSLFILIQSHKKKKLNKKLQGVNEEFAELNLNLEKINKQLNFANSTKDKLFSIVSHDLRSPVASLKQMLDIIMLRYDKLNEEAKHKYINSLGESSNRLYLMFDNLLSWSRLNLGQIKCVRNNTDVNALISNELELLGNNIEEKNLIVEVVELVSVAENIDENIFRIIFRNLMTNAMKFSPIGGRILVALEKHSDKLKLTVKDHGTGIDNATIDSIMNRSVVIAKSGTTNERGNGLGLSIVTDLAELHGGTLEIESESSVGTTVSVMLVC